MKRTECTSRSYNVELTVDEFNKVEAKDSLCTGSDYGLMSRLFAQGLTDIEYNGHFGSFIYYTVEVEKDTEEFRESIEELIVEYAS